MIVQDGRPVPVTEWALRYEGYSPREERLRCFAGVELRSDVLWLNP
jgi:hypothetical protein